MKLRYKSSGKEISVYRFNTLSAYGEILTGDDTVPMESFDAFIEAKQEWKDLRQAFKDHDVITDNYNQYFFEPSNEEDRKRGFAL